MTGKRSRRPFILRSGRSQSTRQPRPTKRERRLRCEQLESRRLLAADMVSCDTDSIQPSGVDLASAEPMERVVDSSAALLEQFSLSEPGPAGEQSVLNIRFDYSLDTSDFFQGAQAARKKELLELAGRIITRRLGDTLAAIPAPPEKFTWAPVILHPSTGRQFSLPSDPVIRANEFTIFAGGRNLPGQQRAEAGPGSFSFTSQNGLTQEQLDAHIAFKALLDARGETGAVATPPTDFAPLVGFVSFDTDTNWDFDDGTEVEFDEFRYLNFAVHELAHVFGFGLSPSWVTARAGSGFQGANARAAYEGSGNIPLSPDGGHWNNSVGLNVGTEGAGQATVMTPTIPRSLFNTFSDLDFAALADIGWSVFAMPQPTLSFTAASQSVVENAQTVTVSASLSAATDIPVAVPVSFAGDADDLDYSFSQDFLYFAPGQTTQSITLTLEDDQDEEDAETIVVSLDDPTGARLGSRSTQTVTVQASDQPPTIVFDTSTQTIDETQGAVSVVVNLSEATNQNLKIPLTYSGNAAGEDFVTLPDSLSIPSGRTSGTITLQVINDPAPESNESLRIDLGSPEGAVLGPTTRTTIVIGANDQPPAVNVSTQSLTLNENVGTATVTVSIDSASESTVTVPFTFAGTANEDDFTPSVTEVSIPPGQTQRTLTLNIRDDQADEGNETLIVQYGSATNGVLQAGQLNFNLIDNDNPVEVVDRYLPPSALSDPVELAGDGKPTAIAFQASEVTTFRVAPFDGSSLSENVRLLDRDLNTIASDMGTGGLEQPLTANEMYVLLFLPRNESTTYSVESTAGLEAVTVSSSGNPVNPTDVDNSGATRALDALVIINFLNLVDLAQSSGGEVPSINAPSDQVGPFYDVTLDGRVSAADALRVINELNLQDQGSGGEQIPLALFGGNNDELSSADRRIASENVQAVQDGVLVEMAKVVAADFGTFADLSFVATKSDNGSAEADEATKVSVIDDIITTLTDSFDQ